MRKKKEDSFQDIMVELIIARDMAREIGDKELEKEITEDLEMAKDMYLEALNQLVGEIAKEQLAEGNK